MLFPRSRRRAWYALLPALVALSILGATSRCRQQSTVHGLTDDSSYAGCALCPVVPDDLGGSFRLIEVPQPRNVEDRHFLVEDVYWVAGGASGDTPITGSGSYELALDGHGDRVQRMKLELRVGDAEARLFDSGLVPVAPDGGGIEISLLEGGPGGTGANVHLRTIPFTDGSRTACGPELSCDADTEICVRESSGFAFSFRCEPAPRGCEEDRSCACVGEALCESPVLVCRDDDAENTIECLCLPCV